MLINIIFYLLSVLMFSKMVLNINYPILRIGEALCVFTTTPYYRLTLHLTETDCAGIVSVFNYYLQPTITMEILSRVWYFIAMFSISLGGICSSIAPLLFFFHSSVLRFKRLIMVNQLDYYGKQFIMVDQALLALP